jgi:hypothetical protein
MTRRTSEKERGATHSSHLRSRVARARRAPSLKYFSGVVPLFPGEIRKTHPCFPQLPSTYASTKQRKTTFKCHSSSHGRLENQEDVQVYVCRTCVIFDCLQRVLGVAEGITHADDSRYLGVLSAFSQAQKEHRRHGVHLATLRAHGKVFIFRSLHVMTRVNSKKDRER